MLEERNLAEPSTEAVELRTSPVHSHRKAAEWV